MTIIKRKPTAGRYTGRIGKNVYFRTKNKLKRVVMSSSKYIYSNKNGSKFASQPENPKSLRSIGRKSARSAVRENKALGLPVTYIKRGKVIREKADGQKEIIGQRSTTTTHSTGVSKGDVIRVQKG